jgi:hypothetical protein
MNLDYFFAMPHVYLKTLIALHLIFRVLRNLKGYSRGSGKGVE